MKSLLTNRIFIHSTNISVCSLYAKYSQLLRTSLEDSCKQQLLPSCNTDTYPGAATYCNGVASFMTSLYQHPTPNKQNALKTHWWYEWIVRRNVQNVLTSSAKELWLKDYSNFQLPLDHVIKNKYKISVSSSSALLNNPQIMLYWP